MKKGKGRKKGMKKKRSKRVVRERERERESVLLSRSVIGFSNEIRTWGGGFKAATVIHHSNPPPTSFGPTPPTVRTRFYAFRHHRSFFSTVTSASFNVGRSAREKENEKKRVEEGGGCVGGNRPPLMSQFRRSFSSSPATFFSPPPLLPLRPNDHDDSRSATVRDARRKNFWSSSNKSFHRPRRVFSSTTVNKRSRRLWRVALTTGNWRNFVNTTDRWENFFRRGEAGRDIYQRPGGRGARMCTCPVGPRERRYT